MFCKPKVKLILECLRAEMKTGRAEIKQGTIQEITAGSQFTLYQETWTYCYCYVSCSMMPVSLLNSYILSCLYILAFLDLPSTPQTHSSNALVLNMCHVLLL